MKLLAAVVQMIAIRAKTRTYNMWQRIVGTFHKLEYMSLSPGRADN
jgi:hypothetical protein